MKKIFVIFLISLLSLLSVNAQREDLTYSAEKFPISKGLTKMKILKNGNTACIELSKDKLLICVLYDINKKLVGEVKVPLDGSFNLTRLRAVMEINNDFMVMLLSYSKGVTPTLNRYCFDGATGKLKNQEIISTIPSMSSIASNGIMCGNNPMSDFFIEKDPTSDYYAVVSFDAFAKETDMRIEVTHYSPTHEKINSAYFASPDNTLKYTFAKSIYVNANQSVIVSSYVTDNPKPKTDDVAYWYLSQLKKDNTVFVHKKVIETKYFFIPDSKFIYSPVNKK
jgi:hypothetical protein